jgi:hypothetical protein
MIYKVSSFKTIFEKKPYTVISFQDWNKLVEFFKFLSKKPGQKPNYKKGIQKGVPLITPAVFEGENRKNQNVKHWAGWCALDIDENKNINIEKFLERFKDYRYICYSTGSSTRENPKCRLIFPLTKYVCNNKIAHFWYAINKVLGSAADEQTKDFCRLFYIPAQYSNAYNFFYYNTNGKTLNVDKLLETIPYKSKQSSSFISKFPIEIQQQILQHNFNNLRNTSITWSDYNNCPFVNKKIIDDYKKITDTGWYHKMYQLMVAIAGNAVTMQYPITACEIEKLCKDIDKDTGKWYSKRPMLIEAQRAIDYVLSIK